MASTTFHLLSPLLLLLLFLLRAAAAAAAPEQEKLTLLRLKSYWNDPPALASWSNASSSTPHCSWFGVSCASGQVTNITLRTQDIYGGIPSFVCDLTNLTVLDLYDNSIILPLPSFLLSCPNLLHLNLGQNYLNGSLPSDLDVKLPAGLVTLDLGGNEIAGDIPATIGEFTALQSLHLDNNYFTGIPPEIGKLTNLEILSLANNTFEPAPLPPQFQALKKLKHLWVSLANLTGGIPEWLGSFEHLEHLDLAMNNLVGTIPAAIWGLKSLKNIYLFHNKLNGSIPSTIGALALQEIDVSMNVLNGNIPADFAKLENLQILYMYYNFFSGEIPAGISRLPSLWDIKLFGNQLTGILPPDLGKYSPLRNLELTENHLSGELPETLCANGELQYLSIYTNNFTGKIPNSLASCRTLKSIRLQKNRLTGDVPVDLWKLPELGSLLLNDNALSGELPDELSSNLTRLHLNNNRFSGNLPRSAEKLLVLYASGNAFSGELPRDFRKLVMLQELSLDNNQITGDIPASIGELKYLTILNMSRNQLTGQIPESIGSLPVLTYLDLSINHLSGEIPTTFDKLKLNYLNLSLNSLTGPIPSSLRVDVFDRSFLSNPGLCSTVPGSFAGTPTCNRSEKSSAQFPKWLIVLVVSLGTVVALTVTGYAFFAIRKLHRRPNPDDTQWKLTPFQYVDFNASSILQGLTAENRTGSGGAGEIYRVSIPGREVVAVKKIYNSKKVNSGLHKEFLAEVEILGSIRHMNIVKLLCCISGENCKMLVYEFMENGSLHQWLHAGNHQRRLDWPTRLAIAVGAARGLSYMHHDCDPPVVHWDVKSSNILLDGDFTPKVADFGLARILATGIDAGSCSNTLKGSLGYMAPECAYSKKVNEKADVYSFGVVLLELTTGRQAHEGGRDRSLVEWVWAHFQEGGSIGDVVDDEIKEAVWMDEVTAALRLALLCTKALPSTRPSMRDVLAVLLRCGNWHRGVVVDKEEEDGPLLCKLGGRSRRVRDLGDQSKEDRHLLTTSR